MRWTAGRRLGTAVLVLAVLVGLAACSDDRERPSDTLPPTSSSPESTTTEPPTPTASSGPNGVVPIPQRPPLADEQSAEGAVAFNEYWTLTLDFLYATLDVEPFRAVSSPECTFCTYVIDLHGPRLDQGYVYQGGRITIVDSFVNAFEGATATVTTVVSVTELVVTDPQGNLDAESGPALPRYQLLSRLTWSEQGWIALDVDGGAI